MVKVYGVSEDTILNQIRREYNTGILFARTKRVIFNNRQVLYNNPMKDEDKVNVNLCYQFMQSLLAIYYTNEPEVQFSSDDIRNEEIAENMNHVFKHDQKEMEMDKRKYLVHRNRFWYGVGIRVMTGRDENRLVPKFQTIDPRNRVPDPNGNVMENDFCFHGFEMKSTIEQLVSSGNYFNLDGLTEAKTSEQTTNENHDREHRGLNMTNDTTMIPIYHHFTIIAGRKFLFTTADNHSRIIRIEEIEAINDAEKKDPSLIKFPVVINAWSPMPGDPYGICVPDIVEDKQKHINVYTNLMLIKSSRMALGNDRLYDTNLIKNRTDLEKPTLGGKRIGVDGNQGAIQNAIYEIPQEQIGQEVMTMPQMLKQIGIDDIGISEQSMGVMADRNVTARESQTAQQNANIRLMLANNVNNRGEEMFAYLCYRSYLEHFREVDKKFVKVNQGFSTMSMKLSKKDFLSGSTPYITIVQKSDMDQLNQQNKANFMAIYPILQQDPTASKISKAFGLRKLLKLNGLTRGEIEVISPPSVDEMNALQQIELINRNMEVQIGGLQEDHLTYLVLFQRAFDTDAKTVAIEARKQAYIQSGQATQQTEMMGGGAANTGANMMMSNAISQGQPGQVTSPTAGQSPQNQGPLL